MTSEDWKVLGDTMCAYCNQAQHRARELLLIHADLEHPEVMQAMDAWQKEIDLLALAAIEMTILERRLLLKGAPKKFLD
jgi:hypothetical protein